MDGLSPLNCYLCLLATKENMKLPPDVCEELVGKGLDVNTEHDWDLLHCSWRCRIQI